VTVARWFFWTSVVLILYSYLLYPCILFVAYSIVQIRRDWQYLMGRRDRRVAHLRPEQLPRVSLVVAAYNEEKHLPEKLANIQELDYQRERLEVIFVSDGSTDQTNDILARAANDQIRVVTLTKRCGKTNALNVGVAQASNDVLVFSDASTLFEPDAVRKLVRHFADTKIGVVCGFLKFKGTAESQQTEGVYWKYETILRLMEARLAATLTASGAIYALRRFCYQRLSPDTVIEDFVIPMRARQLGYTVICDPEAIAIEHAAPSVSGEFTRRVRLAAGSFRALGELLCIRLRPTARLALISHKLLRWCVPFLLICLLCSNIFLIPSTAYRVVLAVQLVFYMWAALGFLFRNHMRRLRFGLIGYFWLAMNIAFLVGFCRFLVGRQDSVWQRVE
jgi:cellulose synthase/poly-beta-1,6-N-acetylglucosamine synthase-like glycosyltransferase